MADAFLVERIIRADPLRWQRLGLVRDLLLPDCWIGTGFVRNSVWSHLHPPAEAQAAADIDVVWHDPSRPEPLIDRQLEATLRHRDPGADWSVRNQARMHARNGDEPYLSTTEAMRFWPETATAVAI